MVEIRIFVLIAINLVFHFSVYNQGQKSKTISTNKNMLSLIDNCCGTHFDFLCMVLHSFRRHNATELFFSTLKNAFKKLYMFYYETFRRNVFWNTFL